MNKDFKEIKEAMLKINQVEKALDALTPYFQRIMNKRTPLEQALIYELIILTRFEKSKYVTAGVLAKRVRCKSKIVSTYLKRLSDKKIVKFRKIDKKNKKYAVAFEPLRDWIIMRDWR